MATIVCWQWEADCKIRAKCVQYYLAQQEGIAYFYAVTAIKELYCRLWWMHEWRNLLTSTHVGYQADMWTATIGKSLKFGVQGVRTTKWFPWVSGAWDKGRGLYKDFVLTRSHFLTHA